MGALEWELPDSRLVGIFHRLGLLLGYLLTYLVTPLK